MNLSEIRRKMENSGMDHDEIETQVDRLADDLVQHDRDENLGRQLQALQAMGYTEDDLERSNPYNQSQLSDVLKALAAVQQGTE